MSEKNIKTKPTSTPKTVKNTPKIVVKGKEAVTNTVKDAKAVMKDTLVKQTIEKQLSSATEQQQSNRPENYAVDNVENTAYTTADTVYHKSKTFVQNRIKEHNHKVKTRENEAPEAPADEQLPNDDTNVSDNQSQVVYRTRTGKKYHRSGCSYLKSKIETTVSEAQSMGLTPCSRCTPPR